MTNDDRKAFDSRAAEMSERFFGPHPRTRNRLDCFGYGMLRLEVYEWAIAVFGVDD